MLRLPKFDYFAPRSLEEASRLLVKGDGRLCLLAGGTDLLVRMKRGEVRCEGVIGLRGIPGLDGISEEEDLIRLGPMVTHEEAGRSALLRRYAGFLSDACRDLGTYHVRFMGTVAGNVCNGSPSGDSLPSLLALEARLKLVGPKGERELPVDRVFAGPFRTTLGRDEILTSIDIPKPPSSRRGVYLKIPKVTEKDETLTGLAMAMSLDSDGAVGEVRIGLGSVAPTPMRARDTELFLKGRDPADPAVVKGAKEALLGEISPRSRAEYRRRMVEHLLEKALGMLRKEKA